MAAGRSGKLARVAAGVIPNPLPKWSRWAIQLGATPNSYLVQFLDYLGEMKDSSDPSPGVWMHIQVVVANNQTQLKADEMIITFDVVNITGGGLDSTWTQSDFDQVIGALNNLCMDWTVQMSHDCTFTEQRYYARSYNPYTISEPFTKSGPPVQVAQIGLVGQQPTPLAHQTAATHTEITPFPKHWGRAYWPAPGAGVFGNAGYFNNAFVDDWCNSVHSAFDGLADAEFFLTVPTTQALGAPSRQLLGVTAIQVDNVPDVIRRRRPWATTHRTSLPLQPA